MSHIRLAILVVSLIGPATALAADGGGMHLYLQPAPAEAARLAFAIAAVSAVTGDGFEYPLDVRLSVVRQPDTARQRLMASGRLPIGSYTGFAVTLAPASSKKGGEEALTLPDQPLRFDVPFVVTAGRAPVFWLTLRYQDHGTGASRVTPVFSVAAAPRVMPEHAGFVTDSGSNTITVFDKNLAQVIAVIDTCAGPAGMALDQRRRRVYVACPADDEIQAIDVATGEIVERSRLSPGDRPREVALAPDGLTLISVNAGSNSISFFDAVSLTRQERINVGSGPASIAIDPAGRRAFVFNTLSSSLSVIDVAGRNLVATLSTEAPPIRAEFNRRGDRLYVIHERSPYMTVLDPRQLTTATRARLRIGVSAIAVDTVRDLVCIGGESDTTIEFYDPNALMPLYSMRTPGGVTYLAFDAEDNSLYMVIPDRRSVAVASLADRKVVAEIDVGNKPHSVAVMGEK